MENTVFSINSAYMIVRLGFVVAASIAAYAVKQVSVKNSRPPDNSKKRQGMLIILDYVYIVMNQRQIRLLSLVILHA